MIGKHNDSASGPLADFVCIPLVIVPGTCPSTYWLPKASDPHKARVPDRLHPFAAHEECAFEIAPACGADVVAIHVVRHWRGFLHFAHGSAIWLRFRLAGISVLNVPRE